MSYPIIDVSDWTVLEDEPVGSKRKKWLQNGQSPNERWLLKFPRKDRSRGVVGEHWAEKIAAEIAEELEIPHADTELAHFNGTAAMISRDFTGYRSLGIAVLGNEILSTLNVEYDPQVRRPKAHTVEMVLKSLRFLKIQTPNEAPNSQEIDGGAAVFVGYLLLDALIGNSDRHHQNWGILIPPNMPAQAPTLAPSFDHASSLGRELTDKARASRLSTSDPNQSVEAYCDRCGSPVFLDRSGALSSVRGAFKRAGEFHPSASRFWLDKLSGVSDRTLEARVGSVPEEMMSPRAKEFACALLTANRSFLLSEG